MRNGRSLLLWTAAGLVGLGLVAWGSPYVFPFYGRDWQVSRQEAIQIALERMRDLGPPVADAYVVATFDVDALLERRLELAADAQSVETVAASSIADAMTAWEVLAYGPGALRHEWTYYARIGLDGEVTGLRRRVAPDAGSGATPAAEAMAQASAFLQAQGFDLAHYEAPQVRSQDLQTRTDAFVRFRSLERALGEDVPYGTQVVFAGSELVGFENWLDDPRRTELQRVLQAPQLFSQTRILLLFVILPFVGAFFIRRYHEGEVGVRRGAQVLALVFLAGGLMLAISARGATQNFSFGSLTRQQTTFAWGAQMLFLYFLPTGLIAMLSWSVGEAMLRERWGGKLAAFDGLLQREWGNATVAVSSLRGVAAGLLLAGGLMGAATALRQVGVWSPASLYFGPWWDSSRWPGLALFGFAFASVLASELFGRLFLVPLLARRFGVLLGGLGAVVLSILVQWPPIYTVPLAPSFALWALFFGVLVTLLVRYDLLTTLLAALVSSVATSAWPMIAAADRSVQLQGALALGAATLPLFLTLRHVLSDERFEYRYEDVPPHVRRIAERERQRVELETARNIQSSILPQLPPSLNGIQLSHAYLPATEVGGDFYDVLALEDGRLAVAVGDVAGHGVSSGLVMSMAKSALAVQVTFDPEVAPVFQTLNRMVYQSARKRLLATLCYALLDPQRRELLYASAGHLFPYRVTRDGKVEALDATEEYPLGVRADIAVRARLSKLDPGDTLVLYSDGLIEARRDGSDEDFGFSRFETALRRHATKSPDGLRDAMLAEVESFTGGAPRQDDLTLLVLRLP